MFRVYRRPKRKHQLLPFLGEYPSAVGSDQDYPSWGLPKANRHEHGIKRQILGHDVYPETPAAYYEGYYPGSGLVQANRFKRLISLVKVPEHNEYPRNFGNYPAHVLTKANKFSYKIRLGSLPELDQFTEPGGFPYPSWLPNFNKTKQTKFRHTVLQLDEFPATPQAYYEGYYPGSAGVTSNKYKFDISRLDVLVDDKHEPATSVADVAAVSLQLVLKRRRSVFRARRLIVMPEFKIYEGHKVFLTKRELTVSLSQRTKTVFLTKREKQVSV